MDRSKPVEFPQLRVSIDDVLYMPNLDAPPDRPHPFVYYVTLVNNSAETVEVMARKWVVVEDGGDTTVVEGDGLVGKKPRLKPGESFSYNSYHVLASDARASGAYFGVTEGGQPIFARIPEFSMTIPQWA